MKKKLLAAFLSLLLMLSLSATSYAIEIPGKTGLNVTYTSAGKIENNADFSDTLKDLQPGDNTVISIAVKNESSTVVDWYVLNEIIETLEENSAGGAQNGGYTYILTYKPSSGSERELYNSNKVGGGGQEGYTTGAEQGLKEIKDALKDYMFLERMASGQSGTVTLYVKLDGESQDNSYQETVAKLKLRFALEVVPTKNVVVTGDNPVELSPVYIGMAVSGVIVLLLAVDGAVRGARKRKEPKH